MYLWHIPALYDAAVENPRGPPARARVVLHRGRGALVAAGPARADAPAPDRHAADRLHRLGQGGPGRARARAHLEQPPRSTPTTSGTPRIWGLSPVDDQNVGGVIMMVEQSLTLVIVLVVLFVRMLVRSEAEERRRERLEERAGRRCTRSELATDARTAPYPSSTAPSSISRGPSTRTVPRTDTSDPKRTSPSTASRSQPTSDGGPAGKCALQVRHQLVVLRVEVDHRRLPVALRGQLHPRARRSSRRRPSAATSRSLGGLHGHEAAPRHAHRGRALEHVDRRAHRGLELDHGG